MFGQNSLVLSTLDFYPFVVNIKCYTHALMMTVRAFLLSLSRNQSIRYPDILGAVVYSWKNLT